MKRARSPTPRLSAFEPATSSAARLLSMPMPVARGSSASSVTRIQPVPVPRSRSLSGCSPPASASAELDQRLGVRAGVERARIDAKRAPVELADPDDARHGLACEPPRHVSPKPRRGVRRERIVDPGDIGFVGQACGMAEQEPRIELRRGNPCLAQQPGRGSMRLTEAEARGDELTHGPLPERRRAGSSDAR